MHIITLWRWGCRPQLQTSQVACHCGCRWSWTGTPTSVFEGAWYSCACFDGGSEGSSRPIDYGLREFSFEAACATGSRTQCFGQSDELAWLPPRRVCRLAIRNQWAISWTNSFWGLRCNAEHFCPPWSRAFPSRKIQGCWSWSQACTRYLFFGSEGYIDDKGSVHWDRTSSDCILWAVDHRFRQAHSDFYRNWQTSYAEENLVQNTS